MDIGPKTVERFTLRLGAQKTVFWNGPMGVFELDQFAKGTEAVARAVADAVHLYLRRRFRCSSNKFLLTR